MSARNRRKQIDGDDFVVPSLPLSDADAALFGEIAKADSQLATISQNGNIQIGSFAFSSTGLSITGEPTLDEWQHVGGILQRLEVSIQWLIGDWMVYGETVWGKSYDEIAETTGYAVGTLYNCAMVARKVQFSRRREKLTFGHHQVVAAMSAEEQEYWLGRAESENWSISQMRREITNNPPPPPDVVDMLARVFADDHRKLKSLVKKVSGVGEGQRAQISQLITEHRRWLDEFERHLWAEDE